MSAETLRKAASLMREEHAVVDGHRFCECENSDHWFDRSICPDPCGSMHDICIECGRIKGWCPIELAGRENGNRLARSWLAVADWLDFEAAWGGCEGCGHSRQRCDDFAAQRADAIKCCPDCNHAPHALDVARAYLGLDA